MTTEIPKDDIDSAAEPPKSAEELQIEFDAESKRQAAREAAKPSTPAEEIGKTDEAREHKKFDEDVVLGWLIRENGIGKDDELYIKFKKVITEKHGENSENLDQTTELLKSLHKLFEQVDIKINKLAKNETQYSKIEKKRIEIIKGVCEPVLDGHLTAEDALSLVSGIEICSRDDPEKKATFDQMDAVSGYEGVMCIEKDTRKMYIFNETLVDQYIDKKTNKPMELKIRHMITHEMSHSIVEVSGKYNKTLLAKANEIIDKAGEIKDSQSIHIRNTLEGIVNADANFAKYFASHLAGSDAYKAMPDEQKKQFEEVEKNKFIADQKIRAAAEILTDYTALYLQSDGSFDNFVTTCTKLSNEKFMLQYFENKINTKDLKKINKEKDSTKKAELIAKTGGKIEPLAKIYKTFFDEIKNQMTSSKGNFAELTSKEGEEEDPFGEYSGGGFMDGPAGFTQQENSGNRDKGGGGDGFWKEAGALIAAIAGEIPNVQ